GSGIPLALDPGWQYDEHEGARLHDNQVILIGTDGIWEMRNVQNQMFGKPAVQELIRRNAHEPADRIARAITDALKAFRDARPHRATAGGGCRPCGHPRAPKTRR